MTDSERQKEIEDALTLAYQNGTAAVLAATYAISLPAISPIKQHGLFRGISYLFMVHLFPFRFARAIHEATLKDVREIVWREMNGSKSVFGKGGKGRSEVTRLSSLPEAGKTACETYQGYYDF